MDKEGYLNHINLWLFYLKIYEYILTHESGVMR